MFSAIGAELADRRPSSGFLRSAFIGRGNYGMRGTGNVETNTICIFCGEDARWKGGELTCLSCATVAAIGESLEDYENRVAKYGCAKAKRRLREK
jgi:hypothetical protein